MKKIQLISIICLFSSGIFAQNEPVVTLHSDIKSITVYLTGAEIVREKSVNLSAGRSLIIFDGLSPNIDPKSIRVTADIDVDILSISHKINYLLKKEEQPRIKQLKDSVQLIQIKTIQLSDEINSYATEKEMLYKNMQLGGQNSGLSVAELKLAADFYRTRIKDINDRSSEINRKIAEFNEIKLRLESELNELNATGSFYRSEISIMLSVEQASKPNIELKYLVTGAGWAPSYDIKAEDVSKPIDFIYRAKVFNNTQIPWKDVLLVLSTADPSVSVTKPKLSPWYLNYNTYAYDNQLGQKSGYANDISNYSQTQSLNAESGVLSGELELNTPITGNESFTSVEVPDLNAEFEITKKQTIPADDKPYIVDVAEFKLDATYKHYAVTKMDKDVFLLANIAGWQDLNLIEGPANIYYAGTYVGESYIYTRNVKDTLDLSLGRDNKVLVTRTKVTSYKDSQLIGNKLTETFDYEIIAKNNRKAAIEIEIIDQIPISQTDEIEVKVQNISGAEQNILTGELKWKLKMEPGESKKLRLTFTVKYPKNKPFQMQQNKMKSMRKF